MPASPSFDDNRALYDALRQRNDRAYDFLYARLAGSFSHWVHTHNGSAMDAEDAFQKGLLNFLLNLESGQYQFQATARITTVLFDYCKKIWLNELQSARMKTSVQLSDFINPADDTDLLADLERSERVATIQKALNQLKEECRQLLQWFYIDELSLREIADKTGLKESSAKAKRYDCAEKLKGYYLQLANRPGV
ncbi:MAG: sigma-70 family RNA polymerase sigma factor [Cytophagaceae bacterium]|nr:sigma-70 family RNA polymerase sigma factor [Cytophagaceae bacterium]